jgi:hypothetical protein
MTVCFGRPIAIRRPPPHDLLDRGVVRRASAQAGRAGPITALASRVVLAWGWRRALIATAAGAAGALAMPPFGVLPALAVSLTVASG